MIVESIPVPAIDVTQLSESEIFRLIKDKTLEVLEFSSFQEGHFISQFRFQGQVQTLVRSRPFSFALHGNNRPYYLR